MKRAALTLATVLAALLSGATPAFADDPVEGTIFTANLVTFIPPSVPAQVSIDWGDGSPTQPSLVDVQADQSGKVGGAHTYAHFGPYVVKVVDKANPDNVQSLSLNVKDAPVTAAGTTFKTAAAPGGVLLATVTDGNKLGNPADFKATVDWGDGTATDATLAAVAGQPGQYAVTGNHAYPDNASYLAAVSIKSTDSGDANVIVQSTADGAPDAPPAVTAGAVLDFGRGDSPSLVVEDDGTADLVWAIPAPGRTGDAIVYCRMPRGARTCSVKRTFQVDALTGPKILRDRFGVLRIVISYNGPVQLGGGTLVMTSSDAGATWGYGFFPVNTGLFQGSIVDATLSRDGNTLFAIFGDFIPGDKSQILASISLDRGGIDREFDPGKVGGVPTYSARSVAVLPDGRVALAGADTRAEIGALPRAALRVVANADGTPTTQPWTPIRGGEVYALASSLRGATLLASPSCESGVTASPVRGLTLGAARPIGSERSLACNAGPVDSLTYDIAGGRHAVWLSDEDGCQGKGPHTTSGTCLIYRSARPGGDFGPKTTIAKLQRDLARGLSVAAGKDGEGWITWSELSDAGATTIKVTPTTVSAEDQVTAEHRIALTFKPGSECSKTGQTTLGVQVVGPNKGKPTIKSVQWSSTRGLLPKNKTDSSGPFSQPFTIDKKKLFFGLSSTGTIVFSMTATANVKYSVGGKGTKSTKLRQTLSFYCGIKFDKVKKR